MRYAKYKKTGIEWLPQVPAEWEVKKVRQCFNLRSQKVSEEDYAPLSVAKMGIVPKLEDAAISLAEGDTRKLVRKNDYVVNSRSDRKGSCGIAPCDGSVTTISIVLEPKNVVPRYIHYLFRSTPWVEEFYRNGRGIVADLWTTRYQEMRNMQFPCPPLAEQEKIVAYLDEKCGKIDEAVKAKEREVELLKECKQSLIAEAVTRGVRGKRKMKDSGVAWIGQVPEEWEVKRVKYLFSISRGRVIAVTDLETQGYPVYSSQTKGNGLFGFLTTYDYDGAQLTWTTDGANAGTVFLREGKYNCTNVCGILTPKNYDFNLKFVYYSLGCVTAFNKRIDINGFKIMSNEMAEIKFTLPPLVEQKEIAEYLDRKCGKIDEAVKAKEHEVELLKELKQSVIAEAVTGQRKVA